jgi:hypothetical protein
MLYDALPPRAKTKAHQWANVRNRAPAKADAKAAVRERKALGKRNAKQFAKVAKKTPADVVARAWKKRNGGGHEPHQ